MSRTEGVLDKGSTAPYTVVATAKPLSLTVSAHWMRSGQHRCPTCSAACWSRRSGSASYGSSLPGPGTDSPPPPSASASPDFSIVVTWQATNYLWPQPSFVTQCNAAWGPWGSLDHPSYAMNESYYLCPHHGPLYHTLHSVSCGRPRMGAIRQQRWRLVCIEKGSVIDSVVGYFVES